MSGFKVSKVMLLAALIKFELENNPNVERTKMFAVTDNDAVKAFEVYAFVNDYTAEIELEIKNKQVEVIIGTRQAVELSSVIGEAYKLKKPAGGFDSDYIIIEAGNVRPEVSRHATERTMMPLIQGYDFNAWRSMAKDIVGMALKKYNVNK